MRRGQLQPPENLQWKFYLCFAFSSCPRVNSSLYAQKLLASAENVDAAVLSSHVCNVAHLQEKTRFDHAGDILEFLLDRKSTRLNSSHSQISYAVFCLQIQN